MGVRVWLGIAENVPVPYGPTRHWDQLAGKPGTYKATPDDHGVMQDGNPFSLFCREGEAEPTVICLDRTQSEVTFGGRTFKLLWLVGIAEPGLLLLITGELNWGDCDETFTAVMGGDTGPFAFAYCKAWNNMGTGAGGRLSADMCLCFGLPASMGHPRKEEPPTP